MRSLLLRRRMMGGGIQLPYTPVEYIQTDGVAYIRTSLAATPPRSAEVKVMLGGNVSCGILCGYTVSSGSNSRNFALLKYNDDKRVGFSHYYNYLPTAASVEYSIDNNKPFIVKTSIIKGAQSISVKQENSDSWETYNSGNNNNVSSTYGLAIFNGYQSNSFSIPAPSGTRLYYCKIYQDENYSLLKYDFVPCLYEGEYGLWDRVSNSFFGNAASSGAFSGPI